MTYAFNVTFTRPDENNANVYTVGYNAHPASSREEGEAIMRRSFSHLTIINVELFAVMNEDGDVLLTSTSK